MANTFRLEFTIPNYSTDDNGEENMDQAVLITLAELHRKIEEYGTGAIRRVMDLNGNTIGSWDVIPSE